MQKSKYLLVIIGLIFSLSSQAVEKGLIENESWFLVSANDCDIPTLEKYIAGGINLNVITRNDKFGMTALMLTTLSGCSAGFDILIDAGADINIQQILGHTVLMKAILYGNLYVAEKLINNPKVDITIKDINGKTALAVATDQLQALLDNLKYIESLAERDGDGERSEFHKKTFVEWRVTAIGSLVVIEKIIISLRKAESQ